MALTPLSDTMADITSEVIGDMAGLTTIPIPATGFTDTADWSWVKVVDPTSGMVAVGLDEGLTMKLTARCLGIAAGRAPTAGEIRDVQAEVTNVIAGRFAVAQFGTEKLVTLGIPRTGRGRPDVLAKGWKGRHFRVDGHWLAVFVAGEGLISTHEMTTIKASLFGEATPDRHFVPAFQARSAQLPAEAPKIIANFRVIDLLGVGGMGLVYKAHHDSLNRLSALKLMRHEFAADQTYRERFLHEARCTAVIDHPNVVPIYDAGYDRGQLYLAMRFAPGGDLATLLRRAGPLPIGRAMQITHQCCAGLDAITRAGMIHRDIKPANILLEDDGTPRLGDLGLARLAGVSEAGGRAIRGTPAFMSPEQAKGEHLDHRSDIYALGATAYTMLCGRPPFAGDSAYEVVAQIIMRPVPDPRSIRADLDGPTAEVILRALERDPARRFQSAGELAAAIDPILRALAPNAGPGNYWQRKIFGS